MSDVRNAHLTDEQFTDCLIGLQPDSLAAAHLSVCEHCRTELARFQNSVGDLSGIGLAWSHAQPLPVLRPEATKRPPAPAWAIASWVMAAALLASVVLPIALRHSHPAEGKDNTAVQTKPAEDSATQIAEDNQLMMNVSMELGEREPSPLREYGIDAKDEARNHSSAQTRLP